MIIFLHRKQVTGEGSGVYGLVAINIRIGTLHCICSPPPPPPPPPSDNCQLYNANDSQVLVLHTSCRVLLSILILFQVIGVSAATVVQQDPVLLFYKWMDGINIRLYLLHHDSFKLGSHESRTLHVRSCRIMCLPHR